MKAGFTEFPYLTREQTLNLVASFANKKGCFFLDSANARHPDSRFDILAIEPKQLFELNSEQLQEDSSKPLERLYHAHQNLCAAYPTAQLIEEPALKEIPFKGGLLFALSYDLGRAYEHIANEAIAELQTPDIFAGFYLSCVVNDNLRKRTLAITLDTDCDAYQQLLTALGSVSEDSNEQSDNFVITQDWQSNLSYEDYCQAFELAQRHISMGDCYQINLAQRFETTCQGDSFDGYRQLVKHNEAPFSAFINLGTSQVLSISPERFISVEHDEVQTRPIKGTMPRFEDLAKDDASKQQLIDSKKDQAENLMIVDLMRNDLSRTCKPGTVKVPELFKIESFQAVHHLVSTVTGTLMADKHAFDLLACCYPGGSITGAPKISAMNIIDQLEPHRRHFYCGSIGYLSIDERMDTNIAIRTLMRVNNKLYCWAGGGIVHASKAELEYQETFDKVDTILPIFKKS
jgi:para-aminobenzoate synthetase component I